MTKTHLPLAGIKGCTVDIPQMVGEQCDPHSHWSFLTHYWGWEAQGKWGEAQGKEVVNDPTVVGTGDAALVL